MSTGVLDQRNPFHGTVFGQTGSYDDRLRRGVNLLYAAIHNENPFYNEDDEEKEGQYKELKYQVVELSEDEGEDEGDSNV